MRRAVDIIVGGAALAVLSPVLAVIAVAVMIESPGSPFYRGVRVGKDGRHFRMWKFRTMVRDADRIGPSIAVTDDQRITRVGAVLRRTKLDELPQLLNLVAGDVTLIGPRAEVPAIVDRYYSERQRRLLAVPPGVTGPGQLHYTRHQVQQIPDDVDADEWYAEHLLTEKLEIDLAYLEHRSALGDLRIIVDTVRLMLDAAAGRTPG